MITALTLTAIGCAFCLLICVLGKRADTKRLGDCPLCGGSVHLRKWSRTTEHHGLWGMATPMAEAHCRDCNAASDDIGIYWREGMSYERHIPRDIDRFVYEPRNVASLEHEEWRRKKEAGRNAKEPTE